MPAIKIPLARVAGSLSETTRNKLARLARTRSG